MLETGWDWDTVGEMELWKALALTEFRYMHPSADSLVAAYLGYKPSPRNQLLEFPSLAEEERIKYARIGLNFTPTAPPVDKLPSILKQRFPFLNSNG